MDNNNISDSRLTTGGRIKAFLTSRSFIGFMISLVVMLVVSCAFFYPDVFEGNELRQHDMQQGTAISHEVNQYEEESGELSRWTNSLFSGMPTFQINPSYPSGKLISFVGNLYHLWLPSPVSLLFMMMTGFFILLLAMKVKWYLALPGAIAYGFSSYFIIIIGAGHIWKFITLAYIPPTIAGIVLAYRGKYLAGAALAAVFAMLQIAGNHIQMSYYFLMVVIGFMAAYGVILFRKHNMAKWWKATGALAAAAILAVAANAPNLYNTYMYSKETMRGKHSELTGNSNGGGVTESGGLNKDYITAWSYGKSETFTLLIPNVKGGATIKPEKGSNKLMSLGDTDTASELVKSGTVSGDIAAYLNQFPQYFGDQPMTNGPVYVGALLVALFLLGCIIVKGSIKWMLLIVTLISIALSWGHNMMWLTDIMIDHFPMYNKFRTVASILVVAEFTIPLLAILALKELFDNRDKWQQYRTPIAVSFGICLLFCLLGIAAPSVFGSYLSNQEHDAYVASGMAQQVPQLFAAIESVRMSMVSADALRSFMIVGLGGIFLCLFMTRKIDKKTFCALLTLIVIGDLYTVNKRYLDTESFVPHQIAAGEPFPITKADRQILADTAMNYRVMNIPQFSEAAPSYRHKTIGGYHAAKLTRYQDMIDRHLGNFATGNISEADMNVINMLNAKYIVMSDDEAYTNPDALGNAWLVDRIMYVNGADAEMGALDSINPAVTAVSDMQFKPVLGTTVPQKMPGDTIYETSYAPNELHYAVKSAKGGVAVFSEVYFPWGWKAWIDGAETEIARVDYLLRALKIPAGSHAVKMRFDPQSLHTTVTVATIAIIIIYLAVIAAVILYTLKLPAKRSKNDK